MNEEAKKSRSPRAPVLNPHHLAKAYAEAEGDFYKVLAWLSSHYNHPYKPQQVKNAYVRLKREQDRPVLVKTGPNPSATRLRRVPCTCRCGYRS